MNFMEVSNTKYWLSFIAVGQSGHTAVAACLDAHPNVIVAEEQPYVRKVIANQWSSDEVIRRCIDYCKGFRRNTKSHRKIDIPIQSEWSGTWRDRLLVAGNKMGWEFTGPWMSRRRDYFTKFQNTMDMPIKLVHVIRNPYDNIASWALAKQKDRYTSAGKLRKARSIEDCIRDYEKHIDATLELDLPRVLEVHIEDFCNNVYASLKELCLFLDIPLEDQWTIDCSKAVFTEPRTRQHSIQWTNEQIESIENIINKAPWLYRYKRDV